MKRIIRVLGSAGAVWNRLRRDVPYGLSGSRTGGVVCVELPARRGLPLICIAAFGVVFAELKRAVNGHGPVGMLSPQGAARDRVRGSGSLTVGT